MVNVNKTEEGAQIQINIDQEKINAYMNHAKEYVGTGLGMLGTFLKAPLSVTMNQILDKGNIIFYAVLQVLAFVLCQSVLTFRVGKIIETVLGSLVYWLDLQEVGIILILKGAIFIGASIGSFILIMYLVCDKFAKMNLGMERIISIALLSTTPVSVGFLVATVMLLLIPSVGAMCILIGLLTSLILGSCTLIELIQNNKDQGIYVVTAIYLLQVIAVSLLLNLILSM